MPRRGGLQIDSSALNERKSADVNMASQWCEEFVAKLCYDLIFYLVHGCPKSAILHAVQSKRLLCIT